MGLSIFGCGSLGNYTSPNPNPEKFSIVKLQQVGDYTVAMIHYKGCTTYEGKKVAVYDCTKAELEKKTFLDPHFGHRGFYPIARFPGDMKGWVNAIKFAEAL